MTAPRLIFVDGLPGSGKSATAHRLCRHLRSLGRTARWVYEHEVPHPIIDHPLVVDVLKGAPLDSALHASALDRWARFAASMSDNETVIFESTFFQTPLHVLFFGDHPRERIREYVADVARLVEPTAPRLVLLLQSDLAASLPRTCARRGEWFAPFLSERIAASPLGRRLGLSGLPCLEEYFRRYQEFTSELAGALPFPTLSIETDIGTWDEHLRRIAGFLDLPPIEARIPETAGADAFAGAYRSESSENEMTIIVEHDRLMMADGSLLFPDGGTAYEVEGTCIRLEFVEGASGRMERIRASGPLPALDPSWRRGA